MAEQEKNLEKIQEKSVISIQKNKIYQEKLNYLINKAQTNINKFDKTIVSNETVETFLNFAQIAAHVLDETTVIDFAQQHGFVLTKNFWF
jgi:predicted Zn-dependent protease